MTEGYEDDSGADDDAGASRISERARHSERRAMPQNWRPPNGFIVKVAGSVAAVIFLIGLLMQLLGWRFTGSGADIKKNTEDIEKNRLAIASVTAATAANTQAIAAIVASNVIQARDIIELKSTLASLMFLQCAIYSKTFVGAPPYMGCVKGSGGQ